MLKADFVFVRSWTYFVEYWVLTESRIPLKPVLGGVRIVALSISARDQTQ